MSCCYNSKSFPVPISLNWNPYFNYHGFPIYHGGYCPACSMPHHHCTCSAGSPMKVYREAAVDPTSTTKEEFVGGSSDARLTLEFMPVAGGASVKVIIEGSDGTATWEMTDIPDGFHVKDDFTSVEPGTKITVKATDCIARLRWCETIRC